MNLKRVGLNTSKAVFTLHGVDQDEKAVLRRNMRRAEMEAFFAKLPPTHVALEACGGSHHWGRRLTAMGHTVQLIPPQYVKPFVRRGKNDRNDAEAISEAAARPEMPSVAVRSAERQAEAIVLSARELLVRQRTQLVHAIAQRSAEGKDGEAVPARPRRRVRRDRSQEHQPAAGIARSRGGGGRCAGGSQADAGIPGRPGGLARWSRRNAQRLRLGSGSWTTE